MMALKAGKTDLDKDQRRIGRLFDDISPTYDQLNHMLSMRADVGWRKRTLEELALRDDDIVLDIATGTGDLAIAAHRAYGCTVIGLDLSRGMMSEALAKWESAFGWRYQAVQGDALRMPFIDGSIDRAMVAFGIRNMPNIGAFLDETRRVLRTRAAWRCWSCRFRRTPYSVPCTCSTSLECCLPSADGVLARWMPIGT